MKLKSITISFLLLAAAILSAACSSNAPYDPATEENVPADTIVSTTEYIAAEDIPPSQAARKRSASTTARIHEDMPEFVFRVTADEYDEITPLPIEISVGIYDESENLIQEIQAIADMDVLWFVESDFHLADYNADGYLDIAIRNAIGGSMGNDPHYYWLWDAGTQQFALNEILTDLSDSSSISIMPDGNLRIFHQSGQSNIWQTYKYIDAGFVLILYEEHEALPSGYIRRTVHDPVSGERTNTTEERDSAIAAFESVLQNENQFISYRHGQIYLHDYFDNYLWWSEGGLARAFPWVSIAVFDINGDGVQEVILDISTSHKLILHYYNGEVYGNEFGSRLYHNFTSDGLFMHNLPMSLSYSIKELIIDGSRVYSASVYDVIITPEGQYPDTTIVHYLNGEIISEEDFTIWLAARESISEIVRHPFSVENIRNLGAIITPRYIPQS